MPLWSIVLCNCLLRFSILFRYQSFDFEANYSRHPCSTSAILSKIPRESVSLIWKCGNRIEPSPSCKPDVVATLLHRIPPASVTFFWKYEAWHYLTGTTHGFCWLMQDIFLLKLCTCNSIVHSIIQNSSLCHLVKVSSGEHPRNSTKRKAASLFRSFCALQPVVMVTRDLTTDLIYLNYVDRFIFCHILDFRKDKIFLDNKIKNTNKSFIK